MTKRRRAVSLAVLLGAATLFCACAPNSLLTAVQEKVNHSQAMGDPVATPQFTPPQGTYASDQSVVATDSTPGATLHYTTDGSTPTIYSAVYPGVILIAGDGKMLHIKAIGMKEGMTDSVIADATYTIRYGPAASESGR